MALASPRGRAASPAKTSPAPGSSSAQPGAGAGGRAASAVAGTAATGTARTVRGSGAPTFENGEAKSKSGLLASQASRLRRIKRTVRHVDVGSVFKVSLVLYMSVLIIVLVAGAILWAVASMIGAIHSFEHAVNQLFGFKSFSLAGVQILLAGVLVGLVMVVFGTLFNVMCAVLYNLTCDIVGGIRIIEVEEAPGPAQ